MGASTIMETFRSRGVSAPFRMQYVDLTSCLTGWEAWLVQL
jgi:hypothetical protein